MKDETIICTGFWKQQSCLVREFLTLPTSNRPSVFVGILASKIWCGTSSTVHASSFVQTPEQYEPGTGDSLPIQ